MHRVGSVVVHRFLFNSLVKTNSIDLHTKDKTHETSDTTLRNFYCLFPSMEDSLQLTNFLKTMFKAENLI